MVLVEDMIEQNTKIFMIISFLSMICNFISELNIIISNFAGCVRYFYFVDIILNRKTLFIYSAHGTNKAK